MLTRILALVIACAACKTAPPQRSGETEASEGPKSGGSLPMAGPLSEDEFKALHEHRGDDAPSPKGTTVEVAGSKAYLSLPAGDAPPRAGVVVIHEWWGLNDHIRHWADRLASAGYAALAVDLYGGQVADVPDDAMKLVKAVDREEAVRILVAAHAFLAEDERVQAKKRASIGWCFGGGMSLALALAAPDQDACVVYYGRPITEAEELTKIKGTVLGVFGTLDASIPPETVDAFEKALGDAGVKHEILRYDAQHAFANPSSARYDQAAAEDAWKRVNALLSEQLRP